MLICKVVMGAEQHRGQRDKTQKCVNFCLSLSLSTQQHRGSREHRRTRQESRGAWPPLYARPPANLSPRLSGTRKAKKSATRDSRYDNDAPYSEEFFFLRYSKFCLTNWLVFSNWQTKRKGARIRIKNEAPSSISLWLSTDSSPGELSFKTTNKERQPPGSASNKTNKMQKVSFLSVGAGGRREAGDGGVFFFHRKQNLEANAEAKTNCAHSGKDIWVTADPWR